ncbi:ATP synthase F1 subunit delta [Sungkyunkwania multivorans]|uniref:ATP synthase subunit delta n=1 Tax=Sungkyunkwania multivorans TaxID=1173618 RepID=A0ABW3D2N0_9FLAO
MTGTRAAIRYAKAILSLAKEQKVADAVNEDMLSIKNTIAENEELKDALQNPTIKNELKKSILKEVFAKVNATTDGLIDVLIENKRIGILAIVAEKYHALYETEKGKETAVVTTAVPLSGSLEKKVLAKVMELTGSEVTVENKIDESIIGGFILRVGDLQYNASIAGKLNNLKREFINN